MEKYIGKCLDSLLIPELDQVEVLVINDGSKDRSSEIAHSYEARYPDSIRVIDKENGNYGSCINTALPIARGRYVKILDADDTFDTEAFSRFVCLLPTLSEDVVFTPFITVLNDVGESRIRNFDNFKGLNYHKTYPFEEAYHKEYLDAVEMHALTYSINLFKKFNYHQTEGISFTDTQWATIPLSHSQTIRFLDISPIYRYLLGREGQTMDPKCFDRQIIHYVRLFSDRMNNLSEFSGTIERKNFLKKKLTRNIYCIYLQALLMGSNETIKILGSYDGQIKFHFRDIYQALDNKKYHPSFKYALIREWRKNGYPNRVNLPISLKFGIFLMSKIFGIEINYRF